MTNEKIKEEVQQGGLHNIYVKPNHKKIIEIAIEKNLLVLMVGETGVGKTSIVRKIAKDKKSELYRLNLTGQTGVDEFLGKWLAGSSGTYWVDGLLIKAMKEGHWIVLDEINMALPEILSALHSLLDDDRKIVLKEKDGSTVIPHDNFRLFATMNPEEEYAGTKELNKAFLSRFPVILHIDYSQQEELIVKEQGNVTDEVAKMLVRIGSEIRNAKKKELLSYTCSTRDLIYAATLISMKMPVNDALETAVLNKTRTEERESVNKIVELITGKKFTSKKGKTFESFEELLKRIDEHDKETEKLEETTKELKNEISELRKDLDSKSKKEDELRKKFVEVADALEKEKKNHEDTKKKAKKLVSTYESLINSVKDDDEVKK